MRKKNRASKSLRFNCLIFFMIVGLIAVIGCSGGSGSTPPSSSSSSDDHGDTYASATSILTDGSLTSGSIETAGDVDFFKFDATAGCSYVIETSDLGSGCDTYMYLYDTDGTTEITYNDDDGTGLASKIEWEASSSGTYYIKVREYSSSDTGTYKISVTESCDEEGVWIINEDESSNHVAQFTADDGRILDYWAQPDADGNPDYVSDVRSENSSGEKVWVQFDKLGRLSYFEDEDGESLRVHYYLSNDRADITVTNYLGESKRAVVELGAAIYSVHSVTGAGSSLDFSKDVFPPLLSSQTISSLSSSCDIAGELNDINQGLCTVGTVGTIISGVGCAVAITADIILGGPTGEGILGCKLASVVVGYLASRFLCGTSDYLADNCEELTGYLGESDSPISPPTTGEVTVETGDVHITLSWDNATDVDLHVTDPNGEEICYYHVYSASGGQLDVDDVDGHGPENIFWPEDGAPLGQYTVEVVYYNDYGLGASNYEVTVRYESEVEEYSGTLTVSGERDLITIFTLD